MTRFCLPNQKQIKERRRKIFLNATMGVGVSRVTSISPFDDLWRGAILFFSSLSTCLPWSALFFFFFSTEVCRSEHKSCPGRKLFISSAAGPPSCTSLDRGALPARRSTLPHYQRNCSGISLPLERLSRRELCSQK